MAKHTEPAPPYRVVTIASDGDDVVAYGTYADCLEHVVQVARRRDHCWCVLEPYGFFKGDADCWALRYDSAGADDEEVARRHNQIKFAIRIERSNTV